MHQRQGAEGVGVSGGRISGPRGRRLARVIGADVFIRGVATRSRVTDRVLVLGSPMGRGVLGINGTSQVLVSGGRLLGVRRRLAGGTTGNEA